MHNALFHFIAIKRGALALVLIFLFAGPVVSANSLKEGMQAFLSGDYQTAISILQPLAESGDADAQETISIMYDFGYGVEKDPVSALKWYEKAALQNRPQLQHDLGVRYFRGDGIPQSYDKASLWWERAASAGVVDSQYNLGLMYAQGLGVTKDYDQAIVWYTEAADKGHAAAQYSLGIIYSTGESASIDDGVAFDYFRKAAAQGLAEAQYHLGLMYERGRGVEKNQAQALAWYTAAANQGLKAAQSRLKKQSELTFAAAPPGPASEGTAKSNPQNRILLELQHSLDNEREKVQSLNKEIHDKITEVDKLSSELATTKDSLQTALAKIASLEQQVLAGNKATRAIESDAQQLAESKIASALSSRSDAPEISHADYTRLTNELRDKSKLAERLLSENQLAIRRQSELERRVAALSSDLNSAKAVIDNLSSQISPSQTGISITELPPQSTLQAYKKPSVSGKKLGASENRIFTTLNQESWIAAQDPDFYALQLIELPSMQLVDKFFDLYPLYSAEKAYFKSRKDGKEVYNIIYGVYPDIASARQELRRLPEDLRKKQPLVRKYETIQQYVSQRGS